MALDNANIARVRNEQQHAARYTAEAQELAARIQELAAQHPAPARVAPAAVPANLPILRVEEAVARTHTFQQQGVTLRLVYSGRLPLAGSAACATIECRPGPAPWLPCPGGRLLLTGRKISYEVTRSRLRVKRCSAARTASREAMAVGCPTR